MEQPDLILFMTDQQRFDQTGYASGGHIDMPVLDELAARGTIFETAYSASTVCVPARVGLLTGVQPHRTPTQENGAALAEGYWTVARALQAVGYETAIIGKMHFSPVHASHGFEVLRMCEHLSAQGLGPLAHERGDTTDDYHEWLLAQGFDDWRFGPTPQSQQYPLPARTHPTAWVEREASEFLARRDRSRPLFLIVSFPHPHAPYNPPEPYASRYDRNTERMPPTSYHDNADLPLHFQVAIEYGMKAAGQVNEPSLRIFLATVRGMLRQIDDAMGRLLEQIDLDCTGVFFTSDHGDYAGHRGLLRKAPWIPFDDLARVPLVAAGLDFAQGTKVPSLVQSSDLPQTWLDLVGIDPPEGLPLRGRSLLPWLTGSATEDDRDRAVFSALSMKWPMVRVGHHKLIDNPRHDARVLFDLAADPHEVHDLAADPAWSTVVDELAMLLHDELDAPPSVWVG